MVVLARMAALFDNTTSSRGLFWRETKKERRRMDERNWRIHVRVQAWCHKVVLWTLDRSGSGSNAVES